MRALSADDGETPLETILIVDDELEFASIVREFLIREGYSVLVASTGAEGLRVLRESSISLALLDLALPDTDGVALMRESQRLDSPPPVVIVTGHATLDSAIAAVEAGAAGYILKPVDFSRLHALIGRVFEHRRLMRENARLHEQAEQEGRRLAALNEVSRRLAAVHETDQILSLIVEEAARLLGAEAAGLRLLEGEELVVGARTESAAALMPRPRLKVGEGLSGRVVAAGEPILVEDLTVDTRYDPVRNSRALKLGFHGFLGVPLRAHGRTIGTLNVYTKSRRRFMPDEVSLLSAFADQASLAIEKARFLRDAEAREKEATRLYEVTAGLASSLDLDRVLDLIVAKTLELLGCEASGIYTYDHARGGLTFRRALHLDPELTRDLVLKPGEGVAGRAFQEGRPLWTRDRLADTALQYTPAAYDLLRTKAPRACLAAPIISRGEVHGVLMDYFFSPHDFAPKEVQLLSALADHAAVAIDNSRLYEEARTQRTRLTQIFDSTSDGIVVVSREGRIESANRRASELLAAFDPETIVGLGLSELFAGESNTTADHDRAVSDLRSSLGDPEQGGEGDLEMSADRRILHWVGRPHKDSSGATVGLTLTFQDVTREREVSKLKSDFVSFVTHQLRTPLSGVKWLLELADQGEVPEETRSFIRDAQESAERLIRLVNDLLDVSRLESGKLTVAPSRPTSAT